MRRAKNQWDQKRGIWQPRISEEMVLKEIVTRLWLQARIKVWQVRERIPGRGVPSTPGIPDLIGWIPRKGVLASFTREPSDGNPCAVPLFIEVKRPGGVRRIAQIQFIDEAKLDGCAAFFAESFSDVVRELSKFGIKLKED